MALINVIVPEAMRAALRVHAKAQTKIRKQRVTMSDVVVQVLRNAGFDDETVLEALARGEVPDVDVRVRTPATRRMAIERVREYLAGRGCHNVQELSRNLHLKIAEVHRAVDHLLVTAEVKLKPFDRPVTVHWVPTCKCATAIVPDLTARR